MSIIKIIKFLILVFSLLIAFFEVRFTHATTNTIQYLSPIPNAKLVSKETAIIIRYKECDSYNLSILSKLFHVEGNISGRHHGKVILSDDNKTLIYKLDRKFSPGEIVSVKLPMNPTNTIGQNIEMFNFSFTISPKLTNHINEQFLHSHDLNKHPVIRKNDTHLEKYSNSFRSYVEINGVSLPMNFPLSNVTVNENPTPGSIFLNVWGECDPYIMILENSGTPIYFKKVTDRCYDFKMQPTGVLTYYVREDLFAFIVMDSTYTAIDTIRGKNGYRIDDHELQILPNGHALFTVVDSQPFDMSKIIEGGNPNAMVYGNHVQVLDKTKNLIFEWRCWDYFKLTDSCRDNLTDAIIDFTHMNAVDVDFDGNILISSRYLNEITKINRETGEIIWRLGGKNNQFTFLNDTTGFSFQHCIRALPYNNYLLFDNGNQHTPPFSRAVQYELDVVTKTAKQVWQYRKNPDYKSWSYGSIQRFKNGNTLINWGYPDTPKALEVRPDGNKVYELDFTVPTYSYRTFRSVWKGKARKPYLIGETYPKKIRLIFNKFGDKNVKNYIIYAGTSRYEQIPVDTTANTYINLTDLKNHTVYYFKVCAVDSNGHHSEFSNTVELFVKFLNSNSNSILNGDFSEGKNYWQLFIHNDAAASDTINSQGEYHLTIHDGGSDLSKIQLIQEWLSLIKGQKYIFEFDAYASSNRIVEVKLERNNSPWENYSKIGSVFLRNRIKHYTFEFTMEYPTDYCARIVFNCGGSNGNIFIDNVLLKEILPSDVRSREIHAVQKFYLSNNYPNPFNLETTIQFEVTELSYVMISIYNVLGELVQEFENLLYVNGLHQIVFDASQFSSGIYFYEMKAQSIKSQNSYCSIKKMLLIK